MGHRNGSAAVRWREDTGWEMRCDSCSDQRMSSFWPLTHEYWNPRQNMVRCRACQAQVDRMKLQAVRRRDPEYAKQRDRERYRLNRPTLLIKRKVYYQEHREHILAQRRERYKAKSA